MEHYSKVFVLIAVCFRPGAATKKASCNGWTLTAPDEGDFRCNPAGTIISAPGTRCTLNCDTGYTAKHEVLVCSEKGGWVPTNSPECQVDSTMTLVIVLSIVASIVVILGLSVLYAKTSTKCRGRRRRLDEEDPETANKRTQNTSTYYDQVTKLQRKRRLHAKRQSRSMGSKRKRTSGSDKNTRKMSDANKLKRNKKRTPRDAPDKKQSAHQSRPSVSTKNNVKNSTKDQKGRKRDLASRTYRNVTTESRKELKRKEDIENKSKGRVSRNHSLHRRKNAMLQNFRTILFCMPFRERRRERLRSKRRDVLKTSRIVGNARNHKKPPDTTATSPVSASSSDVVSSTNQSAPLQVMETSVKSPATLKKPPRPPPPKFSTLSRRSREKSTNDSENDENPKTAVSSGYSSEGGKLRRQATKKSVSEAEEQDDIPQTKVSEAQNKRIAMMSYDLNTGGNQDSNPYDHYPVAQSYRQYLDFENDYRRTTGDYHPQYDNIKVIPLQTVKRKKKIANNVIVTNKNPLEKKPTQGGMKYIDIASKESDDNDVSDKKHNKKSHKERYENPSARDRRTNLDDRHKKEEKKRSKYHKKAERKTKQLHETKKAIADEKIIVNGTTADDALPTTLPKMQKAPAVEPQKTLVKDNEKTKK